MITATTDPGLEAAAERQVETIIAPFRKSLPIAQFAGTDLRLLRDRLASQGMAEGMLSLQPRCCKRKVVSQLKLG